MKSAVVVAICVSILLVASRWRRSSVPRGRYPQPWGGKRSGQARDGGAPFAEIEPAEFRRSTEVTYLGAVWGTKAALRRMVPRDRGTVVQVGSALAFRGIPLQAPYCGAKHALKGFTESVRTELMHDGSRVRITMVQLPALNTPQFEIGRTKLPRHPRPVPPIYQPEVAARSIVWASKRAPRDHFVGPPVRKVNWGNSLAPWLVD